MAKKRNTPRKLPDLLLLKQEFHYDPITGELTDELTGEDRTKADAKGYKTVMFKGKRWQAHRICFYLFHGRDPGKKVIDHIDGNPSNNSIVNLRAVSHRENLRNTPRARKTKPRPANEPGAWKVWAMPV